MPPLDDELLELEELLDEELLLELDEELEEELLELDELDDELLELEELLLELDDEVPPQAANEPTRSAAKQ